MSCQRGNMNRTRSQAHQNTHAFKNNLYDKSVQTKYINTISITGVCTRCKDILEWKMKYKKYKLLKQPKTCVKCLQKAVLTPYRTICIKCCAEGDICAKCGKKSEIVVDLISIDQRVNNHSELQKEIKKLPVRRKNTFLRYISRVVKSAPGGCARGEDEMQKLLEEIIQKLESVKVIKDENVSDAESESDIESDID